MGNRDGFTASDLFVLNLEGIMLLPQKMQGLGTNLEANVVLVGGEIVNHIKRAVLACSMSAGGFPELVGWGGSLAQAWVGGLLQAVTYSALAFLYLNCTEALGMCIVIALCLPPPFPHRMTMGATAVWSINGAPF